VVRTHDRGEPTHRDGVLQEDRLTDWYLARVESVGKAHWRTLQSAIKMGVKIALDCPSSVERDSLADLIITDADPSKDIKALRSIKLVMKGGVVYKNDLSK
jgi:imidazolonepropionase-like amidohydrolase